MSKSKIRYRERADGRLEQALTKPTTAAQQRAKAKYRAEMRRTGRCLDCGGKRHPQLAWRCRRCQNAENVRWREKYGAGQYERYRRKRAAPAPTVDPLQSTRVRRFLRSQR